MPELPEVETIARGLASRVTGDVIDSVWLGSKRRAPENRPLLRLPPHLSPSGLPVCGGWESTLFSIWSKPVQRKSRGARSNPRPRERIAIEKPRVGLCVKRNRFETRLHRLTQTLLRSGLCIWV